MDLMTLIVQIHTFLFYIFLNSQVKYLWELKRTQSNSSRIKCPWCTRYFSCRIGLGTHKRFCKHKPTDNGTMQHVSVTDQSSDERPTQLLPPSAPGSSVPHQNVNNNTNNARFSWGEKSGAQFTHELEVAYNKIVFYRQNLFKLPSGSAGKDYIKEMTRLIRSWSSKSELRDIAWKCVMTMPSLLLQKPSRVSKSKDHTEALKRRLVLWKSGNIKALIGECDTIQNRIKVSVPANTIEAVSKKFATLMKQGKINAAVKLLTSSMEGGVLPLSEETMTLLRSKHPDPADLNEDAVCEFQAPEVHPVIFETINADSIRTAALKTRGGAGPSGMDADGWRHILVSRNFGQASEELRNELSIAIKQMCTEKVDTTEDVNGEKTSSLESFLACRLIPLDKCPGLRPIGVGEVLRRIAGKVFMSVIKDDVQDAVGSLQVCAGLPGGCEAAIHAMRTVFEEDNTDAVLLIDAANAFNSINRNVMLENIQRICPAAYIYSFNCYSIYARLFVLGGEELKSKEGTTQGDPPSMTFYALGSLPLIWMLGEHESQVKQVALADDLTGGGKLSSLRKWLDRIMEKGPSFGYRCEPTKSWLIVKEELVDEAKTVFRDAGVNITAQGKKHLGAAIGSFQFKQEFLRGLVDKWVLQIKTLAEIAAFEPHAAYTAFTSCIRHRYTFYLRTIPDISELLQPLEDEIRLTLIPSLTEGRGVTDDERKLLSLPPRLGGLGIISPVDTSDFEHESSTTSTARLTDAILNQERMLPEGFSEISKQARALTKSKRRKIQSDKVEELRSRMTTEQKRQNEINCESGASNWLTALPIEEKGYHLTKREFWDAVKLRYGWPLPRLPSKCACGENFNVTHAMSCKKGGFVAQRHNELRDMTADLLSEVCKDVAIEPMLNELTGENLGQASANTSAEARLDVSARGVWSRNQRAFFDIRVFNPNARRFQGQSLKQSYITNEKEKKRTYNNRILQVENGTFTPLVFNAFGGMGEECKTFYKRLAAMIAEKRKENLSSVSSWIRTRTSFALLRSTLMCMRGTRHRYYRQDLTTTDMELDVNEASIRPV